MGADQGWSVFRESRVHSGCGADACRRFRGARCFALQGKRHRRLSLAARRDKEPPPARGPARDDPRAEGRNRMSPILFTNARLIDPEAGTDAPGWLLTQKGVIAARGTGGEVPQAETVIDC